MNHAEDIMTSRITRRDFVQTSAGLVITFYLPTRHAAARVDGAEGEFAPNAWLRVGTDGIVTLTVDKAEMGQGSQTGLARSEEHTSELQSPYDLVCRLL